MLLALGQNQLSSGTFCHVTRMPPPMFWKRDQLRLSGMTLQHPIYSHYKHMEAWRSILTYICLLGHHWSRKWLWHQAITWTNDDLLIGKLSTNFEIWNKIFAFFINMIQSAKCPFPSALTVLKRRYQLGQCRITCYSALARVMENDLAKVHGSRLSKPDILKWNVNTWTRKFNWDWHDEWGSSNTMLTHWDLGSVYQLKNIRYITEHGDGLPPIMVSSWHGKTFHITGSFWDHWGIPLRIPLTKGQCYVFFVFSLKKAVEHTVKLPLIWDTFVFMWRHSNSTTRKSLTLWPLGDLNEILYKYCWTNFSDRWLGHLLWNCHQMYVTGPQWWR